MSDCLPLLFDSRSGEHITFSPPKQNILRSGSFSYGDRTEHANRILEEFDTILDEKARQRIKRVSIETPYGKDFPVESLNKNNMELLDWRKFGENHVATVLLPKDADENLRKKITDFRDSDTAKGRPKNEQLVGRIKSFKRAIPDWYWKDSLVPIPQHDEIWIEVWLTRKEGAKEDENFLKLCKEHQIIHGNRPLRFPECLIYPIRADKKKLEVLTANLETVKQCRAWNELSSLVSEDTPAEQVNWTQDILSRLKVPQETAPVVCILDTGCNRHPILEPLMEENTILGVRDEKNGSDINGHGTAMAGIAAYGSLNHVMMNAGGANTFSKERRPLFPGNDIFGVDAGTDCCVTSLKNGVYAIQPYMLKRGEIDPDCCNAMPGHIFVSGTVNGVYRKVCCDTTNPGHDFSGKSHELCKCLPGEECSKTECCMQSGGVARSNAVTREFFCCNPEGDGTLFSTNSFSCAPPTEDKLCCFKSANASEFCCLARNANATFIDNICCPPSDEKDVDGNYQAVCCKNIGGVDKDDVCCDPSDAKDVDGNYQAVCCENIGGVDKNGICCDPSDAKDIEGNYQPACLEPCQGKINPNSNACCKDSIYSGCKCTDNTCKSATPSEDCCPPETVLKQGASC